MATLLSEHLDLYGTTPAGVAARLGWSEQAVSRLLVDGCTELPSSAVLAGIAHALLVDDAVVLTAVLRDLRYLSASQRITSGNTCYELIHHSPNASVANGRRQMVFTSRGAAAREGVNALRMDGIDGEECLDILHRAVSAPTWLIPTLAGGSLGITVR